MKTNTYTIGSMVFANTELRYKDMTHITQAIVDLTGRETVYEIERKRVEAAKESQRQAYDIINEVV